MDKQNPGFEYVLGGTLGQERTCARRRVRIFPSKAHPVHVVLLSTPQITPPHVHPFLPVPFAILPGHCVPLPCSSLFIINSLQPSHQYGSRSSVPPPRLLLLSVYNVLAKEEKASTLQCVQAAGLSRRDAGWQRGANNSMWNPRHWCEADVSNAHASTPLPDQ